jgi:hypothetical protein
MGILVLLVAGQIYGIVLRWEFVRDEALTATTSFTFDGEVYIGAAGAGHHNKIISATFWTKALQSVLEYQLNIHSISIKYDMIHAVYRFSRTLSFHLDLPPALVAQVATAFGFQRQGCVGPPVTTWDGDYKLGCALCQRRACARGGRSDGAGPRGGDQPSFT